MQTWHRWAPSAPSAPSALSALSALSILLLGRRVATAQPSRSRVDWGVLKQLAPGRLVLEGISRGALTAGLLAAHDPSVSGLVLISGVHDLPAYVRETTASPARQMIARALVAETGGTTEVLRARSVLAVAGAIRASTLVLNGAQDERTSVAQARALAEAIVHAGGTARLIIYPEFGHQIPVAARSRDVDPFIDSVLSRRPP